MDEIKENFIKLSTTSEEFIQVRKTIFMDLVALLTPQQMELLIEKHPSPETSSLTLSGRISVARRARGLTQKEMAKLCGLNQGDLSKLERGLKKVGARRRTRIEHVLNVKLGHDT